MMQQMRDQFCDLSVSFTYIVIEDVVMMTYLKTADQIIRNVVLKKCFASVVFATPAPDILSISFGFALTQDGGSHAPHDNAENEEDDGKSGIINSDLLCSAMTTSVVAIENDKAGE